MVNFLMSGRGKPRNTNEQAKRIAAEKAAAEKAATEKAAAEKAAAEKAAAEKDEEHIKIEPVE